MTAESGGLFSKKGQEHIGKERRNMASVLHTCKGSEEEYVRLPK